MITRALRLLRSDDGKFSDRLIIENALAKELIDLDHLSDAVYTYALNYIYLGVSVRADGSPGQVNPVPAPTNPYELEVLRDTPYRSRTSFLPTRSEMRLSFTLTSFTVISCRDGMKSAFQAAGGRGCHASYPPTL